MKEIDPNAALKRLAALCAKREYCSADIDKKLRLWNIDESHRVEIIEKLTAAKYIDDERYARMFIRDKIELNGWGRRKVEQALYTKRIDRSISQAILDEYDNETYADQLLPLLRKKNNSIKADSTYQRFAKLMRFALSRGFDYEVARRCVEQLGVESLSDE